MLTNIIKHVIRYRTFVLLLITTATIFSLYTIRNAPLDALPDISASQVVIYAKWARSAEQIENHITRPIIQSLLGAKNIQSVRATSHLGYSFIYVTFQDRHQRQQIRSLVLDKLNSIRPLLPKDAAVTLGPNASSMGWIYQYALVDRTKTLDLRELRQINESIIKPVLKTVTGIAEIASVGGLERQIELKIFPPLLQQTGVTLQQLKNTLQNAFQQVGGRTIELTNRDYHLRGVVDSHNIDKLEHFIISHDDNGKPILLKDIGYLQVNYDLRRGIADLNGEGEVVGAIVIMEQNQNVIKVSSEFENTLTHVKKLLPDNLDIIITYDRSSLIWTTLKNFSSALGYELLVVMLVIAWALGNNRATVAPVLIILLGSLYTLLSLSFFEQTINLLSLAGLAIAIGEMADATLVIIENCSVELANKNNLKYQEKINIIIKASTKMMRPLLFSLLIIIASFLPIFFLNDKESALFDPLAFSKTFAMFFSTVLTLFLLPIIIVWIFNGKDKIIIKNRNTKTVLLYEKLLKTTIRYRYLFLGVNILLLSIAIIIMTNFKTDYMPEMDEGSLLYMPTTLPGLPIREAGWILQQIDKKIKSFPEVERVFGKLGRANTSTDPAPVTMIETTILLKPKSMWRKQLSKQKLIAEMNAALKIPGYVNSWTQPIAGRMMMQDTGIQTSIGIKVKGNNLAIIESISKKIETLLQNFNDTASVFSERISQGYYINIENKLEKMAQHNVMLEEAILTTRFGIGGETILNIPQTNQSTLPLSMQYSPEYIDTLEKIKNTPVITANSQYVALNKIADVSVKKMPEMIRNDNGQLAAYIYINKTDNITAVDYVESAKKYLAIRLDLPSGYSLEWTGNYLYAEQANARLLWIIPLTLVIMFSLLFLAFNSISISLLILLSTPFALTGGVFLQWFQGYPLTTAVIIGYIAVLAVAIQTGIIMIEFIRESLIKKPKAQTIIDAVIAGSITRLRPKLMTVATTVFSLIPIIMAGGSGMEITRPIASPTVGGMISSTIYVLFLIPCLIAISEDIKKLIRQ